MSASTAPAPDYSLTGANATLAIERGLAEADWYTTPVPKEKLRHLLQRRDGPAIRDTILWFSILALTGWATVHFWGTWWVVIPYLVYAVFYATNSDSRWHECGHGTAFKTDWMNSLLYEVASFMVMRESTVWRWSHNRHHSDTIIVGRDPEIQIPRPPDVRGLFLSVFNFGGYLGYFPSLFRHSCGRMSPAEKTYIPESEFPKVYRNARICLALHLAVVVTAVALQSWIPIFLITLPNFFGTWLMIIHNTTQHAGLAENVLDHRLNCRTVYMNPISRFIYWNMNYHVEHHMFPLVPYHALPKLHETIRGDCPPPYPSILSAWKEIVPAVKRQIKDPGYHVKRPLPPPIQNSCDGRHVSKTAADPDGWIEVCPADALPLGDVVRFDHGRKTFAVIRDQDGKFFATDGICTHGNTHLADGLVIAGTIECPKHNGRFHLADGSPARAPICRGLATYPVENRDGRIFLRTTAPGGAGARPQASLRLKVLDVRNVATFIREITLEPEHKVSFKPGDYLQFEIPIFEEIKFSDFDIPEPYASVWHAQHVFALAARNPDGVKHNNYSMASDPGSESVLRLNVRIATPPPGQDCPPGIGSAYMFQLKPGDTLTAVGPFGDFHIRPTQREMIYIGGGSGMAPLRSHITHLFETLKTPRKVSFWYGARSRQELFYQEHFEGIAARFPNFSFHPALSSPLDSDHWEGHVGFIHEVALENHLKSLVNPKAAEFYLCGPPQMMKACQKMLRDLGVEDSQVTFDEF
jgi:Na+-transporting NADH:ubiquinone oxidoreductase subunit F